MLYRTNCSRPKILQHYKKRLQENTTVTTNGSDSNPLKMEDNYTRAQGHAPLINSYSALLRWRDTGKGYVIKLNELQTHYAIYIRAP